MNHITCPPASPACQLQILGLFSLSNCVTYFHITTLFIFNLLLVLLFWRTLTNASVNVTSSIFGDPLRLWKSIAFGRMISTSLAAEIIGILLLRKGLRNSASALVQWSHSISPGCFYVLVYGKINMRVVFMCFSNALCLLKKENRSNLFWMGLGYVIPRGYHTQPVWVLTSLWGSQISGLVRHLFNSNPEWESPAQHSVSDAEEREVAGMTGKLGLVRSTDLWSVKPALPYLNPYTPVVWELAEPFRGL